MKKIGIVVLSLMTLASASLANAGYCNWHPCGPGPGAADGLLNALLTSYSLLTTTAVNQDDRAAYVQNVQDDAAVYVAGGDESATLKEAIAHLRSTNQVSGSDQEIAAQIVSATN
jgi:hypothetical protein